MDTTLATRKVGDKVSVNSDRYPGIWTIKSIAKVNAVLERETGGRPLRCPLWMLTDPTTEDSAKPPTTYYALGEIVRVSVGKFAGLYVVLADKGGDRVNIALLGGDGDRYVRMSRALLTRVNPADVLKAPQIA